MESASCVMRNWTRDARGKFPKRAGIRGNSPTSSRGSRVALAALHLRRVDALQHQLQIDAAEFEFAVLSRGEPEATLFEAFVPDGESVAVPPEDLEAVAPAIGENEEMAREGIFAEEVAHLADEAVEAATHVGGPGADEDLGGWGHAQHGRSPKTSRTVRSR